MPGLVPGTKLLGTYTIVRQIGAGGMGVVYEAKHARLPGGFAVKLLHAEVADHPEPLARFRQEAEITSALHHPNIVQVVDFAATDEGAPFMVMELLEGEDLAALLARVGHLSLGRAFEITKQIASALAGAHTKGVIHRDLKPQNIFLVPLDGIGGEFIKVLDFGISKVVATVAMTRKSGLIGTPLYMAPEQAMGRSHEVDGRTDQFALAALFVQMLTGKAPFDAPTIPAILHKIAHEPTPVLGAIDGTNVPEVERVIARALSKAPEERYASVVPFIRALDRAVSKVQARTPEPELSGEFEGADTDLGSRMAMPPGTDPVAPRPAPETLSYADARDLFAAADTDDTDGSGEFEDDEPTRRDDPKRRLDPTPT